jgi:hypothetical protein
LRPSSFGLALNSRQAVASVASSGNVRAQWSRLTLRNRLENLRALMASSCPHRLVSGAGVGAYRVSEVDTLDLTVSNPNHVVAAWSIVVFYELAGDTPRNLALFDGLDFVNVDTEQHVSISGFLVPTAGYDAKLGVVTYEGEAEYDGDSLAFNGTLLSNTNNPVDNFFNASRTILDLPVSIEGDLP